MEIGTKVKHKNHLDWGVGVVVAPSQISGKLFVKFNITPFGERPCDINNLEVQS